MTILHEKDPTETFNITFDFSNHMQSINSVVVTCSTLINSRLSSDVTNIASTTPVISGNLVIQKISGGQSGNTYKIRCEATGAEGTFVLTCTQPVRTL